MKACKPQLNLNHDVLEATDLSISRSQRDRGVNPRIHDLHTSLLLSSLLFWILPWVLQEPG